MFRGRLANPCSNKYLYQKDIKHKQEMHKSRLETMKPAIDNKPPKKPTHLTNNKKREQLMAERFLKIERENKLLVNKMASIMSKKTLDNVNSAHQLKSLNKSYRKKELQRITEENQNILLRIQQREPFYNHVKWEEDRKVHEQYMKNICEYPVSQVPKEGGKKKKQRGKQKLLEYSRSGIIPSLDPEYQRMASEKADHMTKSSSYSGFHTSSSLSPDALGGNNREMNDVF